MSDSTRPPSIFDSFNARALRPAEVASTFVPPSHYHTLAKRNHTIIVGPRGSGKTTLLKMLQSAALEAWDHPNADDFRSLVDYTGVFIPTDVSWNAQMLALAKQGLGDEHRKRLSIAAFTTHVLKSLVAAMSYRVHPPELPVLTPHKRSPFSGKQESQLVTHLAQAWHLEPIVPSLLSLKHALSLRLSRVWELALRESCLPEAGRDARLADVSFLHLHVLQSAALAVEQFNDVVGDPDGKWAFLFDELELAPEWVGKELMSSLRSSDDRFIFKLSMSPYASEVLKPETVISAMPDNDYSVIPLWYAHKADGYEFCRALLKSILRDRRLGEREPEEVFGKSDFEQESEMPKSQGYKPGSRHQKRFASLAAKDMSFRKYLRRTGLDLTKLDRLNESDRASYIRKIMPLVIVRDYFRATPDRGPSPNARRLRSRKSLGLYAGAHSLFSIVEGNPRWFLGIIGPMLEAYSGTSKVAKTRQAQRVAKAAQRYCALLRTIPCPPVPGIQSQRGLLTLLNRIGKRFFESIVLEDFDPDVPESFTVDSHPAPALLQGLGQALNAGALVYVPDAGAQAILQQPGSFRGKRFRLSYLLAAYYRLPIRLGPAVALSRLLMAADHEISLPLFDNDGGSARGR